MSSVSLLPSSLLLNVKNVKDVMQFYLADYPSRPQFVANQLFAEMERQIIQHFDDMEGFTFSAQNHFSHLYDEKEESFFMKRDMDFIEMRSVYDEEILNRLRRFFTEKGVTLPGAEGRIFLEPSKDSESFYYASFIVPYRVELRNDTKKPKIHFLVSMQWKKSQYIYWFIGGKRDHGDQGSLGTALREFDEETSGALSKETLEQVKRNCLRCKHLYNMSGTHYYFVPDVTVDDVGAQTPVLSDSLLEEVAVNARQMPSKDSLIAQWREEYGTDKAAYAKAIEERKISFSFDVSQRYSWVSLDKVTSTTKSSIKEDTKTHGTIPQTCAFHQPVKIVLRNILKQEDKLVKMWNRLGSSTSSKASVNALSNKLQGMTLEQ